MACLIRRGFYFGAIAVFAVAPFVFCGCHDSSTDSISDEGVISNDESRPELNSLEKMIYSGSYSGHLVVHVDEALGARLNESKLLYSTSGGDNIVSAINSVVAAHASAEFERSVNISEDEADARRERLEYLSETKLADWNSIYHVNVSDPRDAVSILRELQNLAGVTKVYPKPIPQPMGLTTTPALDSYQTYLKPESTHGGLGVLDSSGEWVIAEKGNDVYVVDDEYGVNLSHEDLGLSYERLIRGGSFIDTVSCAPGYYMDPTLDCLSWAAHGTAVAGILVGRDNGHGITGIAPRSHFLNSSMSGTTFAALADATDGVDLPTSELDEDVEPGSIWVIEMGLPGRCSDSPHLCGHGPLPASCDSDPSLDVCLYGQMPTELWPEDFDAIQQATAYGVTVVAGAGNGQMDLGNPVLYDGEWSFAHNLGTDDAGSVMVGASEGSDKGMISFSNCGHRVNAFAWGQGVVTTGYPYGPYVWSGTLPSGLVLNPSDPNNYYINNFGGTSSAAAMVGGAAALLQSHARAALMHKRYIMPSKMREILLFNGASQRGGGCNIGLQPIMEEAKNELDRFITSAKAAFEGLERGTTLTEEQMLRLRRFGVGIICRLHDPLHSDPICPDSEVFPVGQRVSKEMDFDGDGRADLVQWISGRWKIDLSGIGAGDDNYGAWDVDVSYADEMGAQVLPSAFDMNKDGRTDFVVYDKLNGVWHIAFTDFNLLHKNMWHGWDLVVDYSSEWKDELTLDPFGSDPSIPDSRYSRPVADDYNGDGWGDLGIACSDGYWRLDYGGPTSGALGSYSRSVRYLSPAELSAAPGWAYPVALVIPEGGYDLGRVKFFAYKVPDALPAAGMMALVNPATLANDLGDAPRIFGGNDDVLVFENFCNSLVENPSIKSSDGTWRMARIGTFADGVASFIDLMPTDGWGGAECIPAVADYDGDGFSDLAVMCPNEWRIAYSDHVDCGSTRPDRKRVVSIGYDPDTFTLPGRSYSGGVSYSYVQRSIELYQSAHSGEPPPIPVDMPSFH